MTTVKYSLISVCCLQNFDVKIAQKLFSTISKFVEPCPIQCIY